LGHIIPGRLRLTDAASDVGFRRMQNWITSCDRDHDCYATTAPLPTRVLDVNWTSRDIRLVEKLGQPGKYITLSHCWGAPPPISTTSDTIQSRKRGIRICDLPQTFQDAVTLCRYLKIQYLWIDSLCIIQNDPSDWEQEASRMAEIYAGSYVTLAASSSAHSSTGCFPTWSSRSRIPHISAEASSLGSRTHPFAAPMLDTGRDAPRPSYRSQNQIALVDINYRHQVSRIFIFKEWLPSSHKSSPRSCRIGTLGRRIDPIEHEPLNSRGWTLQERMLPTRILHCGTEQAYWECRQEFMAEDGSLFLKSFLDLDRVLFCQQLPLSKHGLGGVSGMSFIEGYPESSGPWGRQDGGWLAVVESYSKRKLTYDYDKLPALSGLARFIALQTRDGYYAGLWHNHILEDLHWRVYTHQEHRQNTNGALIPIYGDEVCTVVAPRKYRAPSWSWASLDGHIKYVPLDFRYIVAEFIRCYINIAGNDPYGKVSRGSWIEVKVGCISCLRFPVKG
jgi:hypothetical protein